MPYHKVYQCPKGFAFVRFKTKEVVAAVIKDRYHQINGKTVEVKGADEQKEHLHRKAQNGGYSNPHMQQRTSQPVGTIGTIGGGVGAAYGNLAAAAGGQQVLIPQMIGGQTQYVAAQIPAASAAAPQQYVFDPSTNTYYQLPATTPLLGAAGAYNPYAGVQLMASTAGTTAGTQQVQGGVTAGMLSALAAAGGAGQLGSVYPKETSTFGPSRTHAVDPGAGGAADSQVVYSSATSLSGGGESVSTRGYHPYGR